MIARFATRDAQLYDTEGQRLYMCSSEDRRFLEAARHADQGTRLFCELLSYTGCRLSEALATTKRLLDVPQNEVVFRTLKRRRLIHRAIPIPAWLMRDLASYAYHLEPEGRLWPWSRTTGWRRVKTIMMRAGISGAHAMPKGIRHAYGVSAVTHGLPETLLQELLGHSDLSTTAIYVKAVGREKRALVRRMWRG